MTNQDVLRDLVKEEVKERVKKSIKDKVRARKEERKLDLNSIVDDAVGKIAKEAAQRLDIPSLGPMFTNDLRTSVYTGAERVPF